LALTVPAIVQAVAPVADCLKIFAPVVRSDAQHDQPFGAVLPGAMISVLAPVELLHLMVPAHAPPAPLLVEEQAPVPDTNCAPREVKEIIEVAGSAT